jgi:hypothetical protein
MNDIVFVGLVVIFFAVSFGLIVLCQQLMED